MTWANSLTAADVAELVELGRRADSEAFSGYVFLAITIRVLGPIPVAEMSAGDDAIWKDTYRDQFELRSDGCVHLKTTLRVVP